MSHTIRRKAWRYYARAPKWFRRVLNRAYRVRANVETRMAGDVSAFKSKRAGWSYW